MASNEKNGPSSLLENFMLSAQYVLFHSMHTVLLTSFNTCRSLGFTEIGGNAYLSLEDQDEPYQAGIKYTAMPPTKRFRDMEQLSGVFSVWVGSSKRFRDMERLSGVWSKVWVGTSGWMGSVSEWMFGHQARSTPPTKRLRDMEQLSGAF
eukprot:1149514-Pelagomonas_calceolata.AAC.2